MTLNEQLTKVVRTQEVFLIIICHSLFKVSLQAIRILLFNGIKGEEQLQQVTTDRRDDGVRLVVAEDVDEVELADLLDSTGVDELALDAVLPPCKGIVLLLLFPREFALLLPYLFLLGSLDLVLFGLLKGLFPRLEGRSMSSLGIRVAHYDNGLRCLLDLLVFCQEVNHLTHEPWDDLSVQSSLLGFNKYARICQLVEGLLPESSEGLLG